MDDQTLLKHPQPNTLPPINGLTPMDSYNHYQQQLNSAPGSVPNSMPQTPITPHTPIPHTSSAPPDASAYANGSHTNGPQRVLQTLQPPTQYQQGPGSMTPGAQYAAGRGTDVHPRYSLPLTGNPYTAVHQPREPEPTHVVGQQGRRGILPSAPGRPAPSSKMPVPVKNEEGKFPCPNCNKTYLHAKHLKRHMLRRK